MVFPIADDNSDRTSVPFVNVALIVANILVFVLLQGMGENVDFTFAFDFNALRESSVSKLESIVYFFPWRVTNVISLPSKLRISTERVFFDFF